MVCRNVEGGRLQTEKPSYHARIMMMMMMMMMMMKTSAVSLNLSIGQLALHAKVAVIVAIGLFCRATCLRVR
jgi:hypothetical protein